MVELRQQPVDVAWGVAGHVGDEEGHQLGWDVLEDGRGAGDAGDDAAAQTPAQGLVGAGELVLFAAAVLRRQLKQ